MSLAITRYRKSRHVLAPLDNDTWKSKGSAASPLIETANENEEYESGLESATDCQSGKERDRPETNKDKNSYLPGATKHMKSDQSFQIEKRPIEH